MQIGDHPALTIATVPMNSGNMDGSFGKLFRFITGSNAGTEKIAMTTPVLIDTSAEKKTMNFIMPSVTVDKGAPKPAGQDVTLGKVEAAQFAVLRFGGGRTAENEEKAISNFKAWLKAEKMVAKGEPLFACYHPPWTPVFMRRIEVMIRVGEE